MNKRITKIVLNGKEHSSILSFPQLSSIKRKEIIQLTEYKKKRKGLTHKKDA
jgi:hypothetical protein